MKWDSLYPSGWTDSCLWHNKRKANWSLIKEQLKVGNMHTWLASLNECLFLALKCLMDMPCYIARRQVTIDTLSQHSELNKNYGENNEQFFNCSIKKSQKKSCLVPWSLYLELLVPGIRVFSVLYRRIFITTLCSQYLSTCFPHKSMNSFYTSSFALLTGICRLSAPSKRKLTEIKRICVYQLVSSETFDNRGSKWQTYFIM